MRRLRLLLEYDGTDFHGFQVQPEAPTVQGVLEEALAQVLRHPVRVLFASRTDAGVHALGQVVALDTANPIPLERVGVAVNQALPPEVSVARVEEVAPGFHPRFDAAWKEYRYRIATGPRVSPFEARWLWHRPGHLDAEAMAKAAGRLVGRRDFAAFEAAGSTTRDTVRTLEVLSCERRGELVELAARGDGFLYMMVRNLVGTLVEVGQGRRDAGWVETVLASGDRSLAGPTAPARGLCLVQVGYK